MKLVDILARELKAWPDAETVSIVQDDDGKLKTSRSTDIPTMTSCGVWQRHGGGNDPYLKIRSSLSSDYKSAIVTRTDWEAERARIAKPANKANKDGWIRHRGGKCPVEAGVLVEVRLRDGHIYQGDESEAGEFWDWSNEGVGGDIMAYRLHKPSGQPCPVEEKAVERIETLDPAKTVSLEQMKKRFSGPFEWRDRITEINASVEALEEERASLLQRLEAEGFRLIDRDVQSVEDMSDWRNWKVGDELIYTSDLYINVYTKGKSYKVKSVQESGANVFDDGGGSSSCCIDDRDAGKFKFHSRPSK